jgi:hypothetical protein
MNPPTSYPRGRLLLTFFLASILLATPVFLLLASPSAQASLPLQLFLFLLVSYIPASVAASLVGFFGSPEERRSFRRRIGRLRIRSSWYLLALLLPAAAWLAGYASLAAFGKAPPPQLGGLLFFPVILVTNLGEEIGWRGFALPYLMKRFSPLVSSLLLGTAWALYHAPLYWQRPVFGLLTAALILPVSILLTWIFIGCGGSVWPTTLFHAALNAFSQAFLAAPGSEYLLVVVIALFVMAALLLALRYGVMLSPGRQAELEV